MDWLAWTFLENTVALAAVVFVANFVLLVYWRRSGRAKPLLVGLAVSVLLFALQAAVVTRREHALRLLNGIADDIVAARVGALDAALATDFHAGSMDHDDFVEYVERQYDRVRVLKLNRSEFAIVKDEDDQFVAETAYQGDIDAPPMRGWMRTRWELTFKLENGAWRIADIRPLFIDGLDVPSWARIEAQR